MKLMRRVIGRLFLVLTLALLAMGSGCTTVHPAGGGGTGATVLERPIVVIGGWADPGFAATRVARDIRRATGDDRVIAVHPGWSLSFDQARRSVTRAIDKHFPSDDPDHTVEVDVIGISMGGLIARHAIAPGRDELGPELRAPHLFTISAPHTGARLANTFRYVGGTGSAMAKGSRFRRDLAYREQIVAQPYELIAYGRERDGTVGMAGMRLPDHLAGTTIWLDTPWYSAGHGDANRDRRIVEDILRRLGHELDEDGKVIVDDE